MVKSEKPAQGPSRTASGTVQPFKGNPYGPVYLSPLRPSRPKCDSWQAGTLAGVAELGIWRRRCASGWVGNLLLGEG